MSFRVQSVSGQTGRAEVSHSTHWQKGPAFDCKADIPVQRIRTVKEAA